MASVKKISETYNTLKNYNGNNPYLLTLKRDICLRGGNVSDFVCNYVSKNANFEPKTINKIVKVAQWYGEQRRDELNEVFTIEKIKIITLLGETDTAYHCMVKYRQSIEPSMWFIPKKAVITNFLVEDYNKIEIDFERYNKLSNYKRILFEHQKTAVKFLLSRKKCILADDMGLGKMEPISSLIPTPKGFKKMGDIEVGDSIFGLDGNVHTVLNIFPHKDKEIYRVHFSDGTYAECGLEHLWIVRDSNMRIRNKGWKVMSLKEIMDSGIHYNDKLRIQRGLSARNKYQIPVCNPIEYSPKEYLIHPYVLGMCIGDGDLCSEHIAISIPNTEIESVDRIMSYLDDEMTLSVNRNGSCPRYSIIHKKRASKNKYYQEIKRLKLDVCGDYKFIPEEYKFGSVEQRVDLLRGLMDSDGCIRKENKIEYYTNSEILAKDVAELVNSLGGIARIHSYDRSKNGKGVEFHVLIQIKINPFYLKRKAEKYHPTFKKYCSRYISSVEYVRNEDAKCIYVDSEDHSYCTGRNYIVTHNTTSLSVAAIEGNFDSILIICPASLKGNWKRELSFYVPEKDITIIDGFADKTKGELEEFLGYAQGKSNMTRTQLLEEAKAKGQWKDNRVVIINYDIVDKFFDSKRTYTQQQFDEVLENSPLLKFIHNRKSLLIIDEAHELSNTKSIRYKTIKGLINKGKPDSVYLATGTPITNNPSNFFSVMNLLNDAVTSDWEFYMKRYCGAEEFCKDKKEREHWTNIFLKEKKKNTWHDLNKDEKKELNEYLHKHVKYILVPKEPTNLDELSERVAHIYLRREKDILTLPPKTIHKVVYELNDKQKSEYRRLWDEYEQKKLEENPESDLNKDLLESGIYRRYLSNEMIPYTEKLVDELLSTGEKVVIACSYDNELYTLKDYYDDKCVIFNGKMSLKQKDEAVNRFMSDDSIKVFIGNIDAAGVGITLIKSCKLVFNDFEYVPGLNKQMTDRVHRIGQTKDVDIYYQIFNKTQYEKMWDIAVEKQNNIDTVIKTEDNK